MRTSILVAILLCLFTTKVHAIIFDDGGTHNIDYTLADHVIIHSLETFWEQIPATVNVNGAISGNCSVDDNSHVKMYSGSIGSNLSAGENSQIDFFDGHIGGALGAHNHSRINMSGGELNVGLNLDDFSIAHVTGGTTHGIAIHNESRIYFSGSSNAGLLIAHNDSYAGISGGVMEILKIIDNANVHFSGGTIKEYIIVRDNSCLTIYGDGFQIDGVSVGFGTFGAHEGGAERHGLLTGTLANGDVLHNDINISDNAKLILTIAEPTGQPPIADAGADIIANANETVVLDTGGSSDPDGEIVQYTWTREPDNIVLYSGGESTYITRALGRAEEVIKLTVIDDTAATAEDTVSIVNTRLANISQLQEQLIALQQQMEALEQQQISLQQQFEAVQVIVNENREAMEQFTPLQKLLEELDLTLQEEL